MVLRGGSGEFILFIKKPQGLLLAPRLAVGPVGRQGVIHIGGADNPLPIDGFQNARNFLTVDCSERLAATTIRLESFVS